MSDVPATSIFCLAAICIHSRSCMSDCDGTVSHYVWYHLCALTADMICLHRANVREYANASSVCVNAKLFTGTYQSWTHNNSSSPVWARTMCAGVSCSHNHLHCAHNLSSKWRQKHINMKGRVTMHARAYVSANIFADIYNNTCSHMRPFVAHFSPRARIIIVRSVFPYPNIVSLEVNHREKKTCT